MNVSNKKVFLILTAVGLYLYWFWIRLNDITAPPESNVFAAVVVVETRTKDLTILRSVKNKKEYASRHNYHFVLQTKEVKINGDPEWGTIRNGWLKPYMAIQAMKEFPEVEWIWWIDTDAVIMNMLIPLEAVLNSVPKNKHIVMANKCDGVNTGSVLVRNNLEGRVYMERMLDVFLIAQKTWNKRLYEQISIWALEKFDGNRFRQDVQYVADRSINARPPLYGKCKGDDETVRYHNDDFVVHAAGDGGRDIRHSNISKWNVIEDYLKIVETLYKY